MPSRRLVALVSSLVVPAALAAPAIGPSPVVPTYGQPVELELRNNDWPPYLPATRYEVSGSRIVVTYEFAADNFAATRSDFLNAPVNVGELPAGNYTVEARLVDMARPTATPQVASMNFAVMPPGEWGLYPVPASPAAYEPASVMLRSAAYFDPASMRSTIQGNVVRVDFDYAPDAPASGQTPPGLSTFGSVKVGALAPGPWRLEGWGRSRTTGAVEKFFTRDIVVAPPALVVEYYAPSLDHYFMAAGPDEIAQLDANPQLGWFRTGGKFRAWLKGTEAVPGAQPVCRFYARGPNSHFYTGDAGECSQLKALETRQRAEAASKSLPYTGWQYEGIAFYALVPQGGVCPAGTDPVYRHYNGRAAQNDTNHRFSADEQVRSAMSWTWTDEGVAFCSPR